MASEKTKSAGCAIESTDTRAESNRVESNRVESNRAGNISARSSGTRNKESEIDLADSVTYCASMRAMTTADLPEVLRIERQSYQLPWTEQIFRDCLKVGYHMLVLEDQGALSGFVIFSSAAGESHILNLCIEPAGRRQGFAEALLTQAIATVIVAGASVMFLEVRVSNLAAIQLYEKMGFVEAGRRTNYYKVRASTSNNAVHDREDAVVMARDLTSID